MEEKEHPPFRERKREKREGEREKERKREERERRREIERRGNEGPLILKNKRGFRSQFNPLPLVHQNPQKPTQKPALSNGGGSGALASAYNPVSGTFHALDPADPATLLLNPGKFRSIDEPDDHSPTSHGDFDSASNHDSCSGESEDTVPKANSNGSGAASTGHSRTDSVPGCDSEKGEKIRQKNEKKHQHQRERRAHELHEKCRGYLMSRKLESLSQQLVAMGFSQEQATMALIQNEGRVEESVAWLFEGGEESRQPEGSAPDLHCGVGLKIDIADELAKIVELEKRYKCTKQEVERAVVACEGDLVKAEEIRREGDCRPPFLFLILSVVLEG
ncbi:UBA/TS-N domain-containing protein [Carex littledalei]|uniref:UBA/TS-N domain-containing protein n=1 Tax=Carex littledalei TaxID=544730 RepID=A0A833VLK7_9POAL|nr:UBA/TS-N domain-containing protein [Carex littledalei]